MPTFHGYVAGDNGHVNRSSLTATRPPGTQAGDIIFAWFGVGAARTLTAPAGWNLADGGPRDTLTTSGTYRQWLYWRVAQSADPASWTFTADATAPFLGTTASYSNTAAIGTPQFISATEYVNQVSGNITASAGKTVVAFGWIYTGTNDLTNNYQSTWAGSSADVTTRYAQNIGGPSWAGLADASPAATTSELFKFYSGTTSPTRAGSMADIYAVAIGNSAPNAPTLNSPANNATIDLNSPQQFALTPSDPDPGDSTSQTLWRYRIRDIGAAWTTVTQTSPNTFIVFAAGTFAAGNYEWQAATRDAQGAPTADADLKWSASSFFTAAVAPPAPTITAPVNGSTVSSSATVTWSAPNQTDYEVRRVADNAGAANTSVVYSDTGDVVDSVTRSITQAFPTNNRWEHVQVRIKNAGLWSTWADARVQVSFTPPAIPTRVLAADSTTAAITVAIINPTPGAGQPAVAYNDVYVDDDDGLGLVRKATMLATNAAWIYRLPRSGVDYSTRIVVRAVATNGTTADSA